MGEEPPELIDIEENGVRLHINVRRGQKTGLFLDQRPNRTLLQRLSAGKSVLDCFSYTGGFALNAARGGAKDGVSALTAVLLRPLPRRNLASAIWVGGRASRKHVAIESRFIVALNCGQLNPREGLYVVPRHAPALWRAFASP